MGSLDSLLPLKRDPLLRSSPNGGRSDVIRSRLMRLSRLLIVKKLDYLIWVCTVAMFVFFVIVFQMLLPGSVAEKSNVDVLNGELRFVKELGLLDFGENVRFEPKRLLERFRRENEGDLVSGGGNRTMQHFGVRKPRVALVFVDLLVDSHQVHMATVAAALLEIDMNYRFNSILVSSLEAKGIFSCFVQEPCKIMYRGLWLEHSIILRALLPLLQDYLLDNNSSHLKIIVLSGDSTSNYSSVVKAIAYNLKYPSGIVKHASIDVDADNVLSTSHLVIYGSFLEEQSFPDILIKAMCLGKTIVAPDLHMISKYMSSQLLERQLMAFD